MKQMKSKIIKMLKNKRNKFKKLKKPKLRINNKNKQILLMIYS